MIPFIPAVLVQSIVFRILLSLGVSFVTYYSFNSLMSSITSSIRDVVLNGGSGSAFYAGLQLLGLFGVDKGINLILSGYSARIAMASLKRFKMGD